jgi:zinc protease
MSGLQSNLLRPRGWLGVYVAVLLATPPAPAADEVAGVKKITSVEGITEYHLPNGLRVLLFPDPSKPVVTVNLTVLVGSRHEGYGESGMAHLLEHLVFKGTPTFPNVPKALRDHGANFNGTTWLDRTNYFETMPATDENLEFGIHLEADRLVNSFIRREDLLSEFSVVRSEFEQGENNPERILGQRMMAVAFEWHNYGKSTIGNKSDIERVPIDNLQAFYRKYYQVDNVVLVVAGAFDEKKALGLITKHFGALKKPTRVLDTTYTEEPAQDGERNVILRRVGKVGAVGAVYHIPAAAHPDFAAIQVLMETLDTEPTGRLYQALVATKKATSVGGFAFGCHDPGAVQITAQVEGDGVEAIRDLLVDTVENLAKKPLTAEEVDRSKRQLLRSREQLMANSQRVATELSEWISKGDWRLFFLHRDRIEAVTADDVNRVAQAYFKRNNRTVGMFIPATTPQRADIPSTPDVAKLVNDYKGRAAVVAGEAFDPTPDNLEKRVQRGTLGTIQTAFLPKKTRGETVNLQLVLRFGNEESLAGQATPADFIGDMLLRGTKQYTRQQFQDELEKLGATVNASSQLGVVQISVQVKRPNLEATLKLVTAALREPTFPADEFDVLKRQAREQFEKQLVEPTALGARLLQQKLAPFPKSNVRYIPSLDEKLVEINATTVEQVQALYATQVSAQAGELAVVGDFDPAVVKSAFASAFANWTSKVKYSRIDRPANTTVVGGKFTVVTPDKANAMYMSSLMMALKDTDSDYAALEVGNFLLGGGPLSSRLSNRVRGKDGLSYGVNSTINASPIDPAGRFLMYAICNPTNIGKVDAAMQEELAKFLKDGVTATEVSEGQKAWLEKAKVERTSDRYLANKLAEGLFLNRSFQYYAELEKRVAELTPADVQKAFQKMVDPKRLITIEAGDFKKKEAQ